MKRRDFLQCAAVLIGGATVSNLSIALNREQLDYLATAPDYVAKTADLFSAEQRRILAAMAEVTIPRTDTPGAIDAGVPHFIELMVRDWFNESERTIFMAGLSDMETTIPETHGSPFYALPAEKQLAIMEEMEAAAADSPWFSHRSTQADYLSDAPFICHFKELTAWGFFTSEVGSTQVLRHNIMPMKFDGDTPRSPDDSSWSHYRF